MTKVRTDPNKGPLKLEHDITPRNLHHINMIGPSNSYGLDDSHRFKGFPSSNFTEGRDPIKGSPKAVPSVSFKKGQHFVKGRPNVIAKNGVQYGSDELDVAITTSQPLSAPRRKTPFWNEDRSSAEDRKKARQNREAQWDQAQFKQTKDNQKKSEVEAKKKDLQMLKDYKPFGRTGGGAPRGEQEAYRTKAVDVEQLNNGPQLLYFPNFGKPGHGAPLRTDSGKLVTSLRANNDIRFRDGVGLRRGIENKTRYANANDVGNKLNKELGNMALEKRTRKEVDRHLEKEEERRTWEYDPYGKSGAGAPIKTDSGNLITGRARTLAKDPLELKDIQDKPYMKKLLPKDGKDGVYNPWGKGQGAPQYDNHGNTKRLQWGDPNTAAENVTSTQTGVALEMKSFGGGGHLIDEKGERKTRMIQTLQQSANPGDKMIQDIGTSEGAKDERLPWGKPGGGAPSRLPDGRVYAANRGIAAMDMMGIEPPKPQEIKAKRQYLDTLKSEIEMQKSQRQYEKDEVKKPGGETVGWMRSKEVGYIAKDPTTGSHLPIHHKATSDVTRHVMDIRRPGADALDYRTDLVHQAEQRAYQKNTQRKESRQAISQHYKTVDQNWGKPGNGAPYEPAMKRHSLDLNKFYQVEREGPKPAGPNEQPWGRTKALEGRFRDPLSQPAVPNRQQPVVASHGPPAGVQSGGGYQIRAPWAGYSI